MVELAVAHDAVEVVVGLPVSLDGTEGPRPPRSARSSTASRRAWPSARASRCGSSTSGCPRPGPTARCRTAGVDGRRRRAVVDESAAAMILQTALDTERSTGSPAGPRSSSVRQVGVGDEPARHRDAGHAHAHRAGAAAAAAVVAWPSWSPPCSCSASSGWSSASVCAGSPTSRTTSGTATAPSWSRSTPATASAWWVRSWRRPTSCAAPPRSSPSPTPTPTVRTCSRGPTACTCR